MNLTVVVVDDDLDLDLLQLLLSMWGLHVVALDHTGDVTALIHEADPDEVLLDLQTPGDHRAGLTVLAQLRADEITASIPVILMSADHEALFRHAAHFSALGATSLRKPFDPALLCQMIEHAG